MAQDAGTMTTTAIRSRIERTRGELGHTIDAIQDRLSPQRVMQGARETLTEATVGRARRLARQVNDAVSSASRSPQFAAVVDRARNNRTLNAMVNNANAVVNRARTNPTVARVVEQARRNPAAAALIGSAVSVTLLTLIARSRR